jgi:cytochrome P450
MTTVPPPTFVHPFSPAGRADPHAGYRWLRTHSPVHFDAASGSWLLSGYHDCVTALRDPRFSAALGQRERTRTEALPPSMLTTDAAAHARLRAPGALLLGPAAVRATSPAIAAEIDALLDGLAGRHTVEARADIGAPLALGVLATVLRIPAAERAPFAVLARQVSVNLDPLAPPAATAAAQRAMGALTRYLDGHVARLLSTGDDMPVARFAREARLDRLEMLGVLNLAVVGGYQPLVEFVGNALACLCAAPSVLDRLRAGDDEDTTDLAARTVDEVLRLETPIPFTARVATEPVQLSDTVIPAGARVLALLLAANRDPDVFDRPDDLIVDRSPNPHLGFGAGAHLCLAAPLVRLAGRIWLSGLVRRFPRLHPLEPAPRWDVSLVPRRVRGFPLRLA